MNECRVGAGTRILRLTKTEAELAVIRAWFCLVNSEFGTRQFRDKIDDSKLKNVVRRRVGRRQLYSNA